MNPSERVSKYRAATNKPFDVVVPSGHTFTLRKLTPLDYFKEGLTDVPNEFVRFVLNANAGQPTKMSPEEMQKNAEAMKKFLELTLSQGIIDPPVMLTYDEAKKDTHLLWMEINGSDQEFITGLISGRITPESLAVKPEPKPEANVQ